MPDGTRNYLLKSQSGIGVKRVKISLVSEIVAEIMSVRRRASIAGLDFKTNFPKSSGRIGLLKNQSCLDLKYKFRKFLIKLAFIRFEWVLRIRVNDKTFILKFFKSFPISFRKWVWEKNEHCFLGLSQVWQS